MDGLQEYSLVTPLGTFARKSHRTFTHLVIGRYAHNPFLAFHWCASEDHAQHHVEAHLHRSRTIEHYPLAELLILALDTGKVLEHVRTFHFDGHEFAQIQPDGTITPFPNQEDSCQLPS